MKLYTVALVALFLAAGCSSSSNDDDPVLSDEATTDTGSNIEGTTEDGTVENGTSEEDTLEDGTSEEGFNTPGDNGIEIVSNAIAVPEDGDLYQVQDSTTFEILCEGEIICEVPSGTYNVVNLTSGERFEGIVVSGEDVLETNTDDGTISSIPLVTIRADILNELVGYQSESLGDMLYELAINVETKSTAVQEPGTVINNDVVAFNDASTRNSYDCQFGGTLIRESISTSEGSGAATISNRFDSYTFDQCVTELNGGSLRDGNYELTGSYIFSRFGSSSPGGAIVNIVTTWDAFNLQQADGVSYDLTGTLSLSLLSNPGSITTTRDSQIVRYVESSSDTTTLELTDVNFFQELFNVPPLGGTREVRIDGTYAGPLSPDATLRVQTDPEFTESDGVSGDEAQPLTGSLRISSTDGGVLTMTANGPLTISFLSADGTTSETILEELPEFDVRGPGCVRDGGGFETALIEACSF